MTEPRVLIVEARYYTHISDSLIEGAIAAAKARGARYERVTVPGTFEIPAAIAFAAGKFDGYVALGCVIRGETTHYDYVCNESARALMDLAVKQGLAIGYGVVTVENEAQAIARARPDQKNRGGFAMDACLDMIALRATFAGGAR